MGMNIKSAEAHRLAQELAQRTGESLTQAVTVAVRERLERVRADRTGMAERLLAIGRDFAAHMDESFRDWRQLGDATSSAGQRAAVPLVRRPSKPAPKRPAGATKRKVASHVDHGDLLYDERGLPR